MTPIVARIVRTPITSRNGIGAVFARIANETVTSVVAVVVHILGALAIRRARPQVTNSKMTEHAWKRERER